MWLNCTFLPPNYKYKWGHMVFDNRVNCVNCRWLRSSAVYTNYDLTSTINMYSNTVGFIKHLNC